MIKKLGTNGYDFTHLVLANKINEIIDHLPQEKEDIAFCAKCNKGMSKCKCPERDPKTWKWKEQPTKEVLDIRGVLRLLVARSRKKEYTTFIDQEDEQRIDVAFQEISALCRKENV